MRLIYENMTHHLGPDWLKEPNGKDYSTLVCNLIREGETGSYANADDFLGHLDPDGQDALVFWIYTLRRVTEDDSLWDE